MTIISLKYVLVKLIKDGILHIKQVSKKKVSIENLLQRLNKSAATNINNDNLTIEIESMLRKGLIDQDFKILGKQSEQTSTSINNIPETQSFPEIKDLDNRNEENKMNKSPLPLTQETTRALPFDHPRLNKSINSEDDLQFLVHKIPTFFFDIKKHVRCLYPSSK